MATRAAPATALAAAAILGIAALLLQRRRRRLLREEPDTPVPPQEPTFARAAGYYAGDLDALVRDVDNFDAAVARRNASMGHSSRLGAPQHSAYVLLFFVPPREDWAVDMGANAWRDKTYRARAPRTLLVCNWSTLAPAFVGGGVERTSSSSESPVAAVNRELLEELGPTAAASLTVTARDYQFSRVDVHTGGGGLAGRVRVSHYFGVCTRNVAVYGALSRDFFDGSRPALLHEVHGALDVPLCFEAPADIAQAASELWDTGSASSVIGLPAYLVRPLAVGQTQVRDALVLMMLSLTVPPVASGDGPRGFAATAATTGAGSGGENVCGRVAGCQTPRDKRMLDVPLLRRVAALGALLTATPGTHRLDVDELLAAPGVRAQVLQDLDLG